MTTAEFRSAVAHPASQTVAIAGVPWPAYKLLALVLGVLVFGAVFFTEALRAVEVHPLQYGLTGAALAIFFLLLLALSEHIGFGWAYLLAAAVCSASTARRNAEAEASAPGHGAGNSLTCRSRSVSAMPMMPCTNGSARWSPSNSSTMARQSVAAATG